MGYKVMQLEASNLCSLTCIYCPHPSQQRPKGNMSMDVFKKCISLVERSDNPVHHGKKFVWLNHFGEPLLNPLLPEFIAFAVSRNVEVSFASNGVDHSRQLFPRDVWKTLAGAGLRAVVLSAHVKSERTLREHIGDIVDIIGMWKPKPEFFHDWAGQVKKFKVLDNPAICDEPCDYEMHNMFAVTWDGKVAACCYDIEGSVALSIDDILDNGFQFRDIPLCSGCRLGRGDVNWLSEPLEQILS